MASSVNNNSSSSPPIPNRPNPKPRNSEAGDPLRRSFGGNPFPANSRVNLPSDLSRRNSFGGGDKENETKTVPTPKGSKNFMSPTISAVSKINASPRKRVLSDKNEMSRSFSDVKGLILEDKKSHHLAKSCVSFSDVIHTICIDKKKQFEESDDMTITDFGEKEVYENKGVTYSDPRFRISPRPSIPYTSPEFAAREVDTLLPPYDPKKNYLSPRPQFLHYKPNARIEKHFDECKQLEELFISESSSSDTELSIEGSENCEEEEKSGTEAVVEETDEVERLEAENDEEIVCESIELSVLESEKCEKQEKHGAEAVVEETDDVEPLEAESDEEMVCESSEETSQVPKQSGFRKFKFLGWFLALALGYMLVSATFTPPTESSFYDFNIPKEITEIAKDNNLDQLSEKLWTLTESSLVYMDKLISRLGEKEYGPLQFHNLTYTLEDNTVFQATSVEISEAPLQKMITGENNLEDVFGEGGSVNEFEEESGAEENSEVVYETKDGDAETNEFDEHAEMKLGTGIDLNEGEGNFQALLEDGVELNIEELRESEMSPEENHNARGTESQEKIETGLTRKEQEESDANYLINKHVHQQKESEVADAESGSEEAGLTRKDQEESDADIHLINKHEVESAAINVHKEKESELADAESGSEEALGEIAAEASDDLHPKVRSSNKADNDLAKAMILLSSMTTLILLAAIAFLFAKKAKPVAAPAVPEPAPETTTEELNSCPMPVEKNLMKEKLSTLNFEAEEVDDRMSNSFHKKSSFQSEGDKKSSSTSSKLRRESMASSASEYSVGSFSYGSFTTYERIPIKSGDREEEMITPVRRSSRIRNKPSGL